MTIQGIILAADAASRVARLSELKAAFGPQSDDLALSWKYAGESAKRVYCKPVRRQFPTGDKLFRAGILRFAVQFICGDPYIYDDDGTDAFGNPTTDGTSSLVVQPERYNGLDFLTLGFDFEGDPGVHVNFRGGSGGSALINNTGTQAVYPLITVRGPVNNPRFTNQATASVLQVTTNVATGQILVLDFAARTVTLDGVNRNGDVVASSTWWQLQPGENRVLFAGSVTNDDTQAHIQWRNASL